MSDLTPITALGGDAPAERSFGPIRMTEMPDMLLASVALRRGAARPSPFGISLPEPGRWLAAPDAAAFWIGPDQWMIEMPGCATGDFAARLAPEAPLIRLLEKLVNLDLHAFVPGCATRTGLHHTSVFVIRRSPERVAVIGMRSFAKALWHALEQAATRQEAAST